MVSSRRRAIGGVLGGAGVIGGAVLAAMAYRVSPSFWRQFAREIPRPVVPPAKIPKPRTWPDRGLQAAWIGHTTVLMKIDGVTVLTDPVFSTRCGVNIGPVTFGLKRMVAPALDLDEVPQIDLILLSHAHMDHFDVPTLRNLESEKTSVITAPHTSDLLRVERYRKVEELAWGQAARVGPLTVRAFAVNHWGARMRTDTWRGYNGYIIESGNRRVVFGGDTAETDGFRNVASRPVDLAIMPIGAYNPWIRFHCTPEQAWRMANDAKAEFIIPVHHQTFQLSREPHTEPIERLQEAAGRAAHRVATRAVGDEFHINI